MSFEATGTEQVCYLFIYVVNTKLTKPRRGPFIEDQTYYIFENITNPPFMLYLHVHFSIYCFYLIDPTQGQPITF